MTMFRTYLLTALMIFVAMAGMVAPALVDARHWWPQKRKK
jgi:hypothetical protein